MDIDTLKKDIILLKNTLYLDFTASALGLKSIENKIQKILYTYANPHSESSTHAIKTQKSYENARSYIKKSLKLSDDFALIACGSGSTGAIKKFQEILGIYAPPKLKSKIINDKILKSLPLVIIGPYEHHSNELSFREALCEYTRIPLDKDGLIDIKYLEKLLYETRKKDKKRQIIGSFSLASNVTGILSDYKKISKLFRKYGAIIAFDGASFLPYKNIACKYYDALFISTHKFIGGIGGCGLLVINKKLSNTKPSFSGGGTVGYVSRKNINYLKDFEKLEEAGTPPILQLIKASLAFRIKDKIGIKNITNKENQLKDYFFKKAKDIKDIIIYANDIKNRLAIFAINIHGLSPFDLAYKLSKYYKIETRAGCACAGPYGHDLLDLVDDGVMDTRPGWLRVSFHYTHELKDIDYFFDSLKKCIIKLKQD